jgi:orotate phosphoribosyltransferase
VKLKDVLVIDDILTTGATARAAAQALMEAGAASVWVATLARARMRDTRRDNPLMEPERNPGLDGYAPATQMQDVIGDLAEARRDRRLS